MPATAYSTPAVTGSVREHLTDAARRALRRRDGRVVRVAVPLEAEPLAWLAAQPASFRLFWEGRGEAAACASAGEAITVEADGLEALEAALALRLDGLPEGARFYGHTRFAPDVAPDEGWAPFGRVRFTLPRFELRAEDGAAELALHLAPDDDEDVLAAALDALALPSSSLDGTIPSPTARTDAPDAQGWREAVTWALGQFERGPLEKVVLARRARFFLDAPLDPFALLARLRAATPEGYHVLVVVGGCAFVSTTPERLFRVEGRVVQTEAVAGTRPRAAEASSDRRLRDALLSSEKDRREHAYVRDAVAAALTPLTDCLSRDDVPLTLAGAGVRHLYTRLRGTLHEGVSPLAVLRALHPTPAVGGTPTAEALAVIRRLESFDRGLYAAPVGWIGRGAAEVAVGIRSGLVRGETLDLFSGAGIVSGSDPDDEWIEIEHKLGDFLRVLGVA